MKTVKKINGIVSEASFCGWQIPAKILKVEYLNPRCEEYCRRKWKSVESSGEFAFTTDFIEMCQKLVKTKVINTISPSPPFESEMRWDLKEIAFDIIEFNTQGSIPMNRGLFLSDIHLGSKDIRDHNTHNLLIGLLKKTKPDCLIFLGDVIDLWAITGWGDTESKRVVKTVNRFRSMFQEYCDLCKAVFYLPGNHDSGIMQIGNRIRDLIQFDWELDNLLICENICLRGELPVPIFGKQLPGFALTAHGHEHSSLNRKDFGFGRCMSNIYQFALSKPVIQNIRSFRPIFERIPFLGDSEHRELLKFGSSLPDVSLIAGHTHKLFLTIQNCEATFDAMGQGNPPIQNWYKWYINIGSWGYQRSYLLVDGRLWRLGFY